MNFFNLKKAEIQYIFKNNTNCNSFDFVSDRDS
jgi:hypothetical protein